MVNNSPAPGPRPDGERQEPLVKWCAVTLSEVLSKGNRLEASVFDLAAKQARSLVDAGRYPVAAVCGQKGFAYAYTRGRFKRLWVDESDYPIYQPSTILDLKPTPDGYLSPRTRVDIDALRVKKGQVLMTCSGTIGKVAYVSDTLDGLIFSHDLLDLARRVAAKQGVEHKEGVYMGFMGPCYETAAEIRAFAAMGADAVGMSTVPEAMVSSYLGMRVLAVSCITNMATGIQTVRHSHARVLEIATQAGDRMCRWLGEVIQEI